MNRVELRENVFRLIYLSDFHNMEELEEQTELYFDGLEQTIQDENKLLEQEKNAKKISENEKQFVKDRVKDIYSQIDSIDGAINKVAVKWSTERMSKVDLSILRLA